MRIALIGLGDIAQKAYLPLIASDERVTPLLCTRSPQVLGKLARQYRIAECFTEVDALLGSRPDAVMIHAATSVHFALARQCLQAGIPTFVDKPLCFDYSEVEALADLALMQDCPLFVGFNRRYLPAMAAARAQPLTELNWQKHRYALPGLPRPFLFDDFIHVLDSLCCYGGAPTGDLHAVLRRSSQQPELLTGVSVAWQSGQVAVSGSMNRTAGLTEERIDAYGDNLSLHIENTTGSRYWPNGASLRCWITGTNRLRRAEPMGCLSRVICRAIDWLSGWSLWPRAGSSVRYSWFPC